MLRSWGIWMLCCLSLSAQQAVQVGEQAPELDVHDWLNSRGLSLDELRGQAVVVQFWASWCGNCRGALPDLLELYRKHEAGEKLAVVGVHVRRGGDRTTLERFVTGQGVPWPVCIDAGSSAPRWGATDLPAAFVLSHEGVLLWRGKTGAPGFAQAVEDALAAVPEAGAWVASARVILERTVSLQLRQQPLRQLLAQLSESTGIPFRLRPGVDGEQNASLELERTRLQDGLAAMLSQHGLQLEFGRNALLVGPAED